MVAMDDTHLPPATTDPVAILRRHAERLRLRAEPFTNTRRRAPKRSARDAYSVIVAECDVLALETDHLADQIQASRK